MWRDCTDLLRDLGRSPEDGIVRGLVVVGTVGVTMLARYFETGVMMPAGSVAALGAFMVIAMFIGMLGSDKQ